MISALGHSFKKMDVCQKSHIMSSLPHTSQCLKEVATTFLQATILMSRK